MPDQLPDSSPPDQTDWTPAKPDRIPSSTVWPAALALGSTFILWGLASSLIITVVGVCLFAVALAGWIRDIRHERNQP